MNRTIPPSPMPDYATWDTSDLLEALELAGRLPDPDLIAACLGRQDDVTPGLLDMLARGTLSHWDSGDPRWYRDVHAGLLLIAFREPEALPVFDAILRDPERREIVQSWFASWLPEYGPMIVPMLLALVQDPSVYDEGRATALRLLGVIGQTFPRQRDRILPALRGLLPAPGAEIRPDAPNAGLYTWIVGALTDLRDAEPRGQVLALYDAGLIDAEVVGADEYLEEITVAWEEPPAVEGFSMDLLEYYATLGEWDHLSDQDLVEALHDALLDAGTDPESADLMKEDILAALGESFDEDDEEDAGAAGLGALTAELRRQGVPEHALDATVERLIIAAYEQAGDDEEDPVALAVELARKGAVPPATDD